MSQGESVYVIPGKKTYVQPFFQVLLLISFSHLTETPNDQLEIAIEGIVILGVIGLETRIRTTEIINDPIEMKMHLLAPQWRPLTPHPILHPALEL